MGFIRFLVYTKSMFFRFLEKIRNRHCESKKSLQYYPEAFWAWCGVEYIYLKPEYEKNRLKIFNFFTKLKGDLFKVKIHADNCISYSDHVTRIYSNKVGRLDSAFFTKPVLSPFHYLTLDTKKLPSISPRIKKIAIENPVLTMLPKPFDYGEMEKDNVLNTPVPIGLPDGYSSHFIFNQDGACSQNVLHLPIKVSRKQSLSFNKQGRCISDRSAFFSHELIYIPEQLKSIAPVIEHALKIEMEYNPYFVDDYYVFISVSHSVVESGKMQRRGGWHIDGHQGYERLQKNAEKLPCDRQYVISNALPTEAIKHRFDFDKVRKYCKENFCEMDSVNMQDVIEYYASEKEKKEPNSVTQFPVNQLVFLNPYMVHRAVQNMGPPVKRTFLRILCSTYARDRLGDSINPIFGPLYPMKVKTITDIHEVDRQFL